MSDLRTLFISQSYTSLIHTSNDGEVPTGSYIELEDGSGNSLGIEVNRDGNFKIQGEVSASSVNGIGNVTAYSASVDARLRAGGGGSGSDITSLNEFTASQLTINDGYNTFTQSYYVDSASFDTRIDNIVAGTGFVTTGSFNDYTSSTDSRLDSIETTTASLDISVTNLNSYTSSADGRLNSIETTTASLQSQIDNIDTGSLLETASFDNGTRDITFTKADASTFNVNIPGGDVDTGSLLETASVNLNTITFTKADTTTFDITVDTGSAGGATDITALNEFTSSQLTINSGYNTFTESADNRLNSIESETGSYARTDVANNFTGSQTFDLPFDFETKPDGDSDSVFKVDNFQNRIQISLVSDDTFFDREIRFYPSASYSPGYPQDSELGFSITEDGVFTYDNAMGITNTSDEKLLQFRIEDDGDGDNFRIYFNNSLIQEVTYDNDFKIYPNINTVGGIDTNAKCNFLGGAEVQGGFTASMGQGNVFVGGGGGNSIELPTSSLLENSATLSGNNTFDGNQTISGSVNGNVEVITIASSTASIDCSLGNFFTITLPTGETHFTATNITPGQTVSVKVATQTNTTASIDSGTIKMLDGSGYTPTQTTTDDILTFVSYDEIFLYGVVGKNFS